MISAHCLDGCSSVSFLLLYSQLCWPWRRWTGQAWEVRINTTWWPPIVHTYNRTVTADNVEEALKADEKLCKQPTFFSVAGEFDTQDALGTQKEAVEIPCA